MKGNEWRQLGEREQGAVVLTAAGVGLAVAAMARPAAVGSVRLVAIGRHREHGREPARVSPLSQLQVNDDTRAIGKVAYQGARNHDFLQWVRARSGQLGPA